MRNGGRTESLAQVADVRTQRRPETKEDRQGSSNSGGEDKGNNLRRRLGIVAEDVVDLGFGGVAQRCLWYGEGHIGVAAYGQVKDLLLVGRGRAECSNNDRGGNRL